MSNRGKVPSFLGGSDVIVLVNSAAGGGRARSYLVQIQKLFQSFQVHAQFVMTNSAAELESLAQKAIRQGKNALLAMGGDGTFQGLANAAFGSHVLVGVLPMGGGNDFAAALGLPADPIKAAEAVLQGSPRLVDLVRVRTAEGRTRLYAGGGGIGLDAEAARYASGTFHRLPGRARYIASALRALMGFVPIEVRIEFLESGLPACETTVLLAAALNSPTYGAGLRLAPDATLDDGSLDIVLIEDIGTLGILRLLPRLISSGELRTNHVKRWKACKVRITTRTPSAFHGDGEILGLTPVEIEVLPRAARILAPAARANPQLW